MQNKHFEYYYYYYYYHYYEKLSLTVEDGLLTLYVYLSTTKEEQGQDNFSSVMFADQSPTQRVAQAFPPSL